MAGIDSVFIEGGIHAGEIARLTLDSTVPAVEDTSAIFQRYAAWPTYTLNMFA